MRSSIFGGSTILPGLSTLSGSKRCFTSRKSATMREPNIVSWNSERTMPSPCSPECEPLYSRTISKVSSAIARIALTSFSSFRLSTGRTCRQPSEACAYIVPRVPCLAKMRVEPFGVVGEMRQRHCAILDEGDRLALLLHRHHDVEAGGAEVGDAGLQRGLDNFDHAAPFALRLVPAKTEIGHQFAELLQALQIFGLIFLGEFHDQDRIGIAAHGRADNRLEHRDLAAERDHGAVDQFDRDRPQLHQMLGGIHRLVEAAEMADAQHLVADAPARA